MSKNTVVLVTQLPSHKLAFRIGPAVFVVTLSWAVVVERQLCIHLFMFSDARSNYSGPSEQRTLWDQYVLVLQVLRVCPILLCCINFTVIYVEIRNFGNVGLCTVCY